MKQVPEFPKYSISDAGDVWSSVTHKYLKPQSDKRGYLTVKIKQKNRTIHRLMGYTYLGLVKGDTVNHLNGDKKDNRIENLEVCSNAENMRHAYLEGIRVNPRCEKARNAKLTNIEVEIIRSNLGVITQRELANRFGVCRSTISKIKSNKNWSTV